MDGWIYTVIHSIQGCDLDNGIFNLHMCIGVHFVLQKDVLLPSKLGKLISPTLMVLSIYLYKQIYIFVLLCSVFQQITGDDHYCPAA